ncbi:MAG: tetratricopeptide repeat protein [Acidiferrobacterales bacterium]
MNFVYVLALMLFVPSVWFLLRPLSRAGGGQTGSEQWHQLHLVRDRLLAQLHELEQQATDGVIDESTVGSERTRLQAELAPVLSELDRLSAASGGKPEEAVSSQHQRLWWLGTGVLLLPLTVALFAIHSWDTFRSLYAPAPVISAGASSGAGGIPPFVMQMVARLEKRLQKSPDDPQGWSRLGRAYTVLRRLEEAKGAYERSYKLAPGNADIVSAYAGFLYQLNPRQTRGEVRDIYSRLRQLQPDHPGVMWFFGLVAYEEGRFAGALKQWQRLHQFLPPDSDARRSVDKAIAQAQVEMNN